MLSHGQKAWNGVAILSRKPAEVLQRGLPGQEDQWARFVTAQLEDLRFTSVYCPNGKSAEHEDFPRKLAWFETLADHLAALLRDDRPAVIGGDFNICPAAIDSWNEERNREHILHTDAERARFQRLLDVGLADVFRAVHPDRQEFSWWDYRGGAFHRGWGLRIDFLLANPKALERVRSVEIDRDYRKKKDGLTASDHAPVLADLD